MFASAVARASISMRRQSTRYSLASGFLNSNLQRTLASRKRRKRKFTCYLPFMWQSFGLAFTGTMFLAGGSVLCFFGYLTIDGNTATKVDDSSPSNVQTSHVSTVIADSPDPGAPLSKLFVYIGPVLMGIGCFLLVVATVIVCETRDKMLDIIDYRRRNPRDFMTTEPKPDFYRLVVSIGLPSNRRNQVLIEPSVVIDTTLDIDTALDNRSSCGNANRTSLEERVNSRSDLFEDTPLRVEEFNLSTEAVPKQAKKPEYRPKISADPSRRFSTRAVPLPMFGGRKQLRSASLDV